VEGRLVKLSFATPQSQVVFILILSEYITWEENVHGRIIFDEY
jgi:hypothetical protein